jgi:hypothetical protein
VRKVRRPSASFLLVEVSIRDLVKGTERLPCDWAPASDIFVDFQAFQQAFARTYTHEIHGKLPKYAEQHLFPTLTHQEGKIKAFPFRLSVATALV